MASTRLLQGNDHDIFWTFTEGSTPTDATGVSVTVTRANGTVLTAPVVSSEDTEPGVFSAALLASEHTLELDDLSIEWTGTVGGKTQTHRYVARVLGGHYVSLLEMRRMDSLTDTQMMPDYVLEIARNRAESSIDNICETSFTPAYGKAALTHDDLCRGYFLPHTKVRGLRSVSVAGVAEDLADWAVTRGGEFSTSTNINLSFGEVVEIEYEYGDDYPDDRLSRAAALYARHIALDNYGAITDRARLMQTEFGLFVMDTAGKDKPTGLPEVDAILCDYNETGPASFA